MMERLNDGETPQIPRRVITPNLVLLISGILDPSDPDILTKRFLGVYA